jgi:5-oxoprolinase (ATP-hydrolysing)
MLHRFGLREGSAGMGQWHGGEGVVRELEFLEPMQVSILSEVLHYDSQPQSVLETNTI